MSSAADTFLTSLEMPSSDGVMAQLNQTKEKLQDARLSLAVLQEAAETVQQLPDGQDRERLLKELRSHINKQKLLIERDSIKVSVKESYLKSMMTSKGLISKSEGKDHNHGY